MRRWLRFVVVTMLSLSMAIAVSTPAQAVSREGTWRGPTSQGYTIRFHVGASQRVTSMVFKVDISGAFCSGTMTWQASGISAPIRPDGTFVVRGQDGLDSFVVRGDFVARNRATGTLRTSVIEGCVASGRASWVAHRI
jgi:hypothetical protein